WPVQRLAEIICHVNLPYLSGPTTYSDATALVVRTLHANRLQDGPQRTGRQFSHQGCRRPVSRDIPPTGDGLQAHRQRADGPTTSLAAPAAKVPGSGASNREAAGSRAIAAGRALAQPAKTPVA